MTCDCRHEREGRCTLNPKQWRWTPAPGELWSFPPADEPCGQQAPREAVPATPKVATSNDWEPVWYWLDDGQRTPGVLISDSLLVVNLNTPAGQAVIGRQDWFDADYVRYWNGLVPECAEHGTEPGQWSPRADFQEPKPAEPQHEWERQPRREMDPQEWLCRKCNMRTTSAEALTWACVPTPPAAAPAPSEAAKAMDWRQRTWGLIKSLLGSIHPAYDEMGQPWRAKFYAVDHAVLEGEALIAAAEQRAEKAEKETKRMADNYRGACADYNEANEERDDLRAKLAAAEANANNWAECERAAQAKLAAAERELAEWRKVHNGYDPEMRKAMPDMSQPETPKDAVRELVEEAVEIETAMLRAERDAARRDLAAAQQVLESVRGLAEHGRFEGRSSDWRIAMKLVFECIERHAAEAGRQEEPDG